MKTKRILASILLVFGMLLAQSTAAYALPPLPNSVHGTVRVNGASAPPGATVTAWINGELYASSPVSMFNGESVFSLIVPGDDPSTERIEGGKPGDRIAFRIDDRAAFEIASWSGGGNTALDLTASDPGKPQLYFPLVMKVKNP